MASTVEDVSIGKYKLNLLDVGQLLKLKTERHVC